MNENTQKLKELLIDILLIDDSEFSLDLKKDNVLTWDSLGVVSIGVGVHQVFGYHFTPEEAMSINSVQDIITLLEEKGVKFNGESN